MSKPKPGLGKGLVRTLAQHPSSSSSTVVLHHPLQLAPVISQQATLTPFPTPKPSTNNPSANSTLSSSFSPTSISSSSNALSSTSSLTSTLRPFIPATSATSTSSYLSLLPTWDSPNLTTSFTSDSVQTASRFASDALSVVSPYRTPSNSISFRITAPIAIHAFGQRSLYTSSSPPDVVQSHPSKSKKEKDKAARRGGMSYTSSSAPNRAMSLDPSSYQMLNSAFLGPIPYGPSVPPSLLDKASMFSIPGLYNGSTYDIPLNDFSFPPPPPPSPSPSQPPQTIRPSRSSETHTVLSPAPPVGTNDSGPSPSISLSSQPSLAYEDDSSPLSEPSENPSEPTNLKVYSSSLIFHLGASGLAKERTKPPPQRRDAREPPPARQRAFPLPDTNVPAPQHLKSIGVGEDAYFARIDGMCIADGVGGWARSGRGGADAGRWSRLLTHFCEVEVDDWWAGTEGYVTSVDPPPESPGKGHKSQTSFPFSTGQHRGASSGGSSEWAKKAWQQSVVAAKKRDDSQGLESGFKRRPLNPVEIMQKGFEKCLACVTAEGVHGSSTCLLALLHHSTLLVANLGDCSLLLVRGGEVIFRTTEMQHAFNFPMQLGTQSRDEPMKDAKRYDIGVERGDVVVVGSDGLMDNLFENDILNILSQFAPPLSTAPLSNPQLPTTPASRPTTPIPPPFSPQQVSDALCKHARYISEQSSASTPFMEKALKQGIDFAGGKKDDISVLVGVVGDREPSTSDLDGLRLQHT